MSDLNPYAAPKAPIDEISGESGLLEGVWSDGQTLIMTRDAILPPRCLKCNEPTDRRLERSLSWHHPAIYLVVLVNLIIYAALALAVRKTAKVAYPLCEAHLARRRRAVALGWLESLSGIAVVMMAGADLRSPLNVVGALMLLAGVIGGVIGSRVVKIKRIDELFVYLDKVNPDYLAELPELPRYVQVRTRRWRDRFEVGAG